FGLRERIAVAGVASAGAALIAVLLLILPALREKSIEHSVLLVFSLAFAVAVALAFALSAPLARPMRRIIDTANRIAKGDLSTRTEIERKDEIGDLGRAFDHMVDELQTYARAVTSSHEELQRAELFLQSLITHLPMFLSVKRASDLRFLQVNPE